MQLNMFYKDDCRGVQNTVAYTGQEAMAWHLNSRVTSEAWTAVGVRGRGGGDWTELRESQEIKFTGFGG